jgi:lysophospholipase L1-like esterase
MAVAGVPHVEVYEVLQEKMKTQHLLIDGLHPNDAGHKLISGLVLPELEKLLAV